MVRVYYDSNGVIQGFYPDEIEYPSYPNIPYIEIDESTHLDCINHQGLRKVDLVTKKIVEYTPLGPTVQQQYAAINAEYSAKQAALRDAAIDAQLNGESLDSIVAARKKLSTEWKAKLSAVQGDD